MSKHEAKFSKYMEYVMQKASNLAIGKHHELLMPEHLLCAMLSLEPFDEALWACNDTISLEDIYNEALDYLNNADITVPGKLERWEPSSQLTSIITEATINAHLAESNIITLPMVVQAMLEQKDSEAAYILHKYTNADNGVILREMNNAIGKERPDDKYIDADDDEYYDEEMPDDDFADGMEHQANRWKSYVTCINDNIQNKNPLIGRDKEIERTIQVLCRKEKNNPLHIGEPGVGKTALIYGIAARIEEGNVPERLKGCRIYQLDMGTLLAGARYRGDMEKRLKTIVEGVANDEHAILYIDEVHTIVGAGQGQDGANDVSNLLKPYLDGGAIRVIGATTYAEYNKYLSRSTGLTRRFQTIDIKEPSVDETINIIQNLKPIYERYHHVKYDDEAIKYAVNASAKFITDRYLPDKAIDLIDEAGAQAELECKKHKKITKKAIAEVLSKIAKVNALAIKQNDNKNLATLENRIKAKVYGQDHAIQTVVNAVQMAKAGLTDGSKPLASLLFVGPTGVGKTEVAKTLAEELGVKLVRFDMSEYMEKHTVAKLIGAPAGYVGYDDGGLLTDAVRNTPDCVLLLDEIEKAHTDIYNILLQVMDYGVLTDNKGRKAHFKNVVLIMTSNAGAQYAAQATLGFASTATAGGAMLKQVKRTFKPEFINRLSEIVVFNDMDKTMAQLILNKKLGELDRQLAAKSASVKFTAEAINHLLAKGYSKEYGAREMDRVIQRQLKTLLMKEILFGKLKKGGEATVDLINGKLTVV